MEAVVSWKLGAGAVAGYLDLGHRDFLPTPVFSCNGRRTQEEVSGSSFSTGYTLLRVMLLIVSTTTTSTLACYIPPATRSITSPPSCCKTRPPLYICNHYNIKRTHTYVNSIQIFNTVYIAYI